MSGVLDMLSLLPSPQPVIRADSGIEGIIYIIILMIWGIAQAIKKGKQAPSSPQPRTPTAPGEMPEELRQMLETLTGQKIEPVRPPPPPPPLPAEIRIRRDRVPRRRAEPMRPVTQMQAPVTAQQPQQPMKVEYGGPERMELTQLPRTVIASHTMKGLTTSLKSVRIPTANTGMAMSSHFGTGRGTPVLDLRDRARLRQAILGQAILGKPKAFAE